MLDTFRLTKTTKLGSYLIIFSLLIKMLMPVAHASTAVSGEKTGFFAALCTANGVVLVNPDQTNQPSEQHPSQLNSSTICPLCLLLEQGLYDSTAFNPDTGLTFIPLSAFHRLTGQVYVQSFNPKQFPIRAPPFIS